ncbi:uncharacterized protein LOC142224407 [Haematobia irritans]|uniref:uncharacterized protein LOC142224407 n=1 Tax=Haematobia irritans TaxID=7368 RepID=UPI003F50D09C
MQIKNEWERSCSLRRPDNILSHVHLKNPRIFRPSYELEGTPVLMSWLLGMEYARIWTKEKNNFIKDGIKKSKAKFIENDYWNWIEKRKPKTPKNTKPPACLKNFDVKGKR